MSQDSPPAVDLPAGRAAETSLLRLPALGG